MATLETIRGLGEVQCGDERLGQVLSKKRPICLDVFEPAGRLPLAQGLIKSTIVNKLLDQGCSVRILIDDWVAEQKGRLGGDPKKLKAVGEYMIEIWKAIGMKVDEVEFSWSSEFMLGPSTVNFSPIMLDVARHCELPRLFKCLGIEGSEDEQQQEGKEQQEGEEVQVDSKLTSQQREIASADLLFPCIQCANIFYLEPDICFLGSDKRNITEFVEKYCDDYKRPKPIMLVTSILPSLKEGVKEMSRSELESCIFMDDEESDVKTKIKKAFCPPNVVAGNPCITLVKQVVFPKCKEFPVVRVPEYGGNKTYTSSEDLCADYASGALHPGDLKVSLTNSLNKILQPVREHLKNNQRARELLKQVKKYRMT